MQLVSCHEHSWNNNTMTHSACCFCDLCFPNTQQVTVNPITSPISTTTIRPITPPKVAIGLTVLSQLRTSLLVVCSGHVWRVWSIVLLITEPITSWYVLHTTPRSMEWPQMMLTVGVQLRVLLVVSVQLYTGTVSSVMVPFLNTSAPIKSKLN